MALLLRGALKGAMLVGLAGWLGGCATVPDDYRDPRDPWESYNRGMHQFNTDFDNAFFKPVALIRIVISHFSQNSSSTPLKSHPFLSLFS